MSEHLSRHGPATSGCLGTAQIMVSDIHLCFESMAFACHWPEGSSLQVLGSHVHCLLHLRQCCQLHNCTGKAAC